MWKHAEVEDFEWHALALSRGEKNGLQVATHETDSNIFFSFTVSEGHTNTKIDRFVEAKSKLSNHNEWKHKQIKSFSFRLHDKICILLKLNANYNSWVMRLPSKNDHEFETSLYKVPQIPRLYLLTSKSWNWNRQPLTGSRINRLPCSRFWRPRRSTYSL